MSSIMSRSVLVLLISLFLVISAPIVLGSSSSSSLGASAGSSSSATSVGSAVSSTSTGAAASSVSSGSVVSAMSSSSGVSSVSTVSSSSPASSVSSLASSVSSVSSAASPSSSSLSGSGRSSSSLFSSSSAGAALSSVSSMSSSAVSSSSAAPQSSSSAMSSSSPMSSSSLSSMSSSSPSSSSSSFGSNSSNTIIPPPVTNNTVSSSSSSYVSSSSSAVYPNINTCAFSYYAVPNYLPLTYFWVNVSFTYNQYVPLYNVIYGTNATCYKIITLNGVRIVYTNDTVSEAETVTSISTATPVDNVVCIQSPYITTGAIALSVSGASGAYVNQGTNVVYINQNVTNYGNTSSGGASQYESYTDNTNVARVNPITDFTLAECAGFNNNNNNNNNNNGQTSDAYATAKLSSYIIGAVIAVATTLLMAL